MRSVPFPALDRNVSVLGFGCASLGSRISAAPGLKALELAFDRGVTWYDVAPPYGDGQAEALVGSFLKRRRDEVVICTKVGIPRPQISLVKKLVRPAARWAVKAIPDLRGYIAKGRAPNARPPIDPAIIRSSVETSLRLLKTDHIDVLALHEPTIEDCTNPQIREALAGIVQSGYARAISIAGTTDAIAAGAASSNIFQVAQLADGPYFRSVERLRHEHPETKRLFFITHSVFGLGTLSKFAQQVSQSRETALPGKPSDLLLDYALAENASGVVLVSMYSQSHIEYNCARASRNIDLATRSRIDALVAAR
jgi:aryl-alcohol dehydrogenase-like predicted oxidoreductase